MALFGLLPDAKASAPPINRGDFQYGGWQSSIDQNGNLDTGLGARKAAQGFQGQAAAYQQQALARQQYQGASTGEGMQAVSAAQQAGGAANAAVSGVDQARAQQLAALQRQQQGSNALAAYAAQAQGPSAAQAQLQQGANQSFAQQLAMARSGTGSSGGAAALRNAAFQQAGIMGQANSQAAQLRAQEDQNYRQNQLAALGAAQQGYGAEAATAQGLRGSDVGAAQLQAQTALGAGGLEAQTRLGFGQQQVQSQGLSDAAQNNLNQLGLQYNQLGNVVNQDQLQADMQLQALRSGQSLQASQFNAGVSNASTQGDINTAAAAMGAIALMSDIRGKRDIEPLSADAALAARDYETYQGRGDPTAHLGVRGSSADSPVAAYDHDRAAAFMRQLASRDARPSVDLRAAVPYSYAYKDPSAPGAAPGRHVGPMAQDLAQTDAASAVRSTPRGLSVDAGRLALAQTPAIGELQQNTMDHADRISALENRLAAYGATARFPNAPGYQSAPVPTARFGAQQPGNAGLYGITADQLVDLDEANERARAYR